MLTPKMPTAMSAEMVDNSHRSSLLNLKSQSYAQHN
jgi:hypothetical protein